MRQLLFERRQGCFDLGKRGLLRGHVEPRDVSQSEMPALYLEQHPFDFDAKFVESI